MTPQTKQNGLWMSVGVEGIVSSSSGYAGQSRGIGLNFSVVMDLS